MVKTLGSRAGWEGLGQASERPLAIALVKAQAKPFGSARDLDSRLSNRESRTPQPRVTIPETRAAVMADDSPLPAHTIANSPN
ncbi:hypothetical protein Ddc_10286 [Ditylenchus destructor]|nr:hypothetical protein Ddc_10286 [Ditylenchus destructor]